MPDNTVQADFELARKEGRQPRCPYCHAPLAVGQAQVITLFWRWNPEKSAYENKVTEGDAYRPFCLVCKAQDWGFLDAPMTAESDKPRTPKTNGPSEISDLEG